MLPFKLHTVTTLTDMVDPDAPCPTRHALEASEGPASGLLGVGDCDPANRQ